MANGSPCCADACPGAGAGAGAVRAIGETIHSGRQTAIAEGRLVDETGRQYAHATTTCMVFDLPAGK